MSENDLIQVIDKDGTRGIIDTSYVDKTQIFIRLEDGHIAAVPRDSLIRRDEANYYLPLSLSAFYDAAASSNTITTIPLVEEILKIDRQNIETGKVRVMKTVREDEVTVNEPVFQEHVQVTHVPINQYIDAPVAVRYEGDTLIVPVVEEVLFIQKRTILREEIHITKQQVQLDIPQSFVLRREEVQIERDEKE